MSVQVEMLSELKSAADTERAELTNQLSASHQQLSDRTRELQRLQENFDQVNNDNVSPTNCCDRILYD